MAVNKESIKEVLGVSESESEHVASFINGLLDRAKGDGLEEIWEASATLNKQPSGSERPCGRSEGPCCGGQCG
jgi:hypothetical protein